MTSSHELAFGRPWPIAENRDASNHPPALDAKMVASGLVALRVCWYLAAASHLVSAGHAGRSGGARGMAKLLGRLLCLLGLHDFQIIDVTFGFGAGGNVAKVECKRCGYVTLRPD